MLHSTQRMYDLTKCNRAMTVKGWTQSALAKRIRLSNAVISNFFTGKSVRRDVAKKIITALGLRMEDVVLEEAVDETSTRADESSSVPAAMSPARV